jgi:hypothetical protein
MAATGKAKAAGTSEMTLTFAREKETPGTVRFKEDSDLPRPAVGTLYITKTALEAAGLADANGLTVTVEAND